MAITILRPTSLGTYYTDSFTNGIGAGTHLARTNDNSDTTSIRATGGTAGGQVIEYLFSGFTTPGGSYIRRVRVNIRQNFTTQPLLDFAGMYTYAQWHDVGASANLDYSSSLPSTTIATYTSGWYPYRGYSQSPAQGVGAWVDADINGGVSLAISASSSQSGDVTDVYDVWLEVETNVIPTATTILPASNVTTTTRPIVKATYNDSDNDISKSCQFKIFSAAQYGIGGFNPASSPNTWDSGVVSQGVFNLQVIGNLTPNVDLTNGTTYKVYVQLVQSVDSKVGAWTAGTAFAMAISAPAQPVLTATVDDANARITLAFQGRDNLLSYNDSSFETSVAGYTQTNATLSRVTSQSRDAAASMQLSSTAGGNMAATSATGTNGVPVIANQTYEALASVKSAVSVRSCRIDIIWYTAAGATISTSNGTAANDATGGWTQIVCAATAPGTAAFAAVVVNVLATGAAAEVHFVDQVSIAPLSSTVWSLGGFNVAGTTYIIEKSVDAGVTWSALRGSAFAAVITTQAMTIYDYEALPAQSTQYRARVSGVSPVSGSTVTGINSATATATSNPTMGAPYTGWYLKDPLDATQNQAIDFNGTSFDTVQHEEMAVYKPLGRSKPLIVTDVIRGEDGELHVECDTLAKSLAFEAIRNQQHTLLLQRAYADPKQWYIRLRDDMSKVITNHVPPLYQYKVKYVEVDAP